MDLQVKVDDILMPLQEIAKPKNLNTYEHRFAKTLYWKGHIRAVDLLISYSVVGETIIWYFNLKSRRAVFVEADFGTPGAFWLYNHGALLDLKFNDDKRTVIKHEGQTLVEMSKLPVKLFASKQPGEYAFTLIAADGNNAVLNKYLGGIRRS